MHAHGSLFWLLWFFVMGWVLQFGEIVHKRVYCYYYGPCTLYLYGNMKEKVSGEKEKGLRYLFLLSSHWGSSLSFGEVTILPYIVTSHLVFLSWFIKMLCLFCPFSTFSTRLVLCCRDHFFLCFQLFRPGLFCVAETSSPVSPRKCSMTTVMRCGSASFLQMAPSWPLAPKTELC